MKLDATIDIVTKKEKFRCLPSCLKGNNISQKKSFILKQCLIFGMARIFNNAISQKIFFKKHRKNNIYSYN